MALYQLFNVFPSWLITKFFVKLNLFFNCTIVSNIHFGNCITIAQYLVAMVMDEVKFGAYQPILVI